MAQGRAPGRHHMVTDTSSDAGTQPSLLRKAAQGFQPRAWDVALALFFCAIGLAYVLAAPNLSPTFHRFDAAGLVLLLAMTLPLMAARSYPWVVFATIGIASVLGAAFDQPAINVGYWCGAIALY